MTTLNKYQLYCETEAATVQTDYRSAVPIVCPNNNAHTIDADSISIIASLSDEDVNIKSSAITLPSQEKGFQDLSGHNVYRFGDLEYPVVAGETNIFHEKFAATMYISGGGVTVPEFVFIDGTKTEYKPEKGDYLTFDLVDIDNIIGYGKTATIAYVARSSNVATITTVSAHTFVAGEKVCVNASSNTFDNMEVAIASVPDNTHLTYANTGDDVSETSATGSVGKIIVLAPFVPYDKVFPKKAWNISERDAKAVPPGVYLRFKCVSIGSTDWLVYVYYNLRT